MTTTLEGVRGQRHAPAALYPRERHGTQCTGGWVGGPVPVWTGVENLAPTGIRSPDRAACSQSLYLLSYRPARCVHQTKLQTYSSAHPIYLKRLVGKEIIFSVPTAVSNLGCDTFCCGW